MVPEVIAAFGTITFQVYLVPKGTPGKLKFRAVPLQMLIVVSRAEGTGATWMVKDLDNPVQLLVEVKGVTVMVAVILALELLLDMKEGILPVPVNDIPMEDAETELQL